MSDVEKRAITAREFVSEMRDRGVVTLDCDALRYHLALLLRPEGHPAVNERVAACMSDSVSEGQHDGGKANALAANERAEALPLPAPRASRPDYPRVVQGEQIAHLCDEARKEARAEAIEECAKVAEMTQPTMTGFGGTGGVTSEVRYEPNPYAATCAANIRALRSANPSTKEKP